MELLYMKIFELFWDTILDFFKDFMHIKLGWGGGQDTPARVSSSPPTILDTQSDNYLDR